MSYYQILESMPDRWAAMKKELDALRKRNEKLERVAEAARSAVDELSPYTPLGRPFCDVDAIKHYTIGASGIDNLTATLSALDKEEKADA